MNKVRYIGIIADGTTDQEIISKFVKCMLERTCPCEEIMLGQSLTRYMDAFRRNASSSNKYGLLEEPSSILRNGIIMILHAAIKELQSQIPRALRDNDLVVVNTDAEWHLKNQDQYFKKWAIVISKIFLAAIEEFYHKTAHHGYQREHLPLIVPLVFFPSTDILVAAAKIGDTETFNYHDMNAKEIKIKLYGVDDLRYLRNEDLKKKALKFITIESCKAIYKHIPESRIFLRTLLWNQVVSTS